MDIDKEIEQRVKDTEDHFTERKESAQEHRIRETMVAFANSAIPDKPGIIFIGMTDKGEIKGVDNPDKTQKDVSSWAKSSFPPLPVIPRVVTVEGKAIVTVVVEASPLKPHFAKAAYKRVGSQNFQADQSEIDEWIAYRNSKVRKILDRKNQIVNVQLLTKGTLGGGMWTTVGPHTVLDCNAHWVTLKASENDAIVTHPLSYLELKLNDNKPYPPGELCLLVKAYW